MKVQFDMTLHEDQRSKEPLLNRLEIMFDDPRNPLPKDYFFFSDAIPYGSRIRVTMEVVEGDAV